MVAEIFLTPKSPCRNEYFRQYARICGRSSPKVNEWFWEKVVTVKADVVALHIFFLSLRERRMAWRVVKGAAVRKPCNPVALHQKRLLIRRAGNQSGSDMPSDQEEKAMANTAEIRRAQRRSTEAVRSLGCDLSRSERKLLRYLCELHCDKCHV